MTGLESWRAGLPELSRPLVMGVVNVTPDSFSDGGLYETTEAAIRHAFVLREEGADLLDIGGESTRPGATRPLVAEELLAFASSHRADLVVTGAHGRTLVERLLIGSVTTKLLRAAQCAVLIIPPYSGDRDRRAEEAE